MALQHQLSLNQNAMAPIWDERSTWDQQCLQENINKYIHIPIGTNTLFFSETANQFGSSEHPNSFVCVLFPS
jgi:hypothetical protein